MDFARLKPKCWQGRTPSKALRRICFLLIQVIGRIWFIVVVGLRSPSPCWLSAESCSQLLEVLAFLGSWLPFFIFKANKLHLSDASSIVITSLSDLPHWETFPALEDSSDDEVGHT